MSTMVTDDWACPWCREEECSCREDHDDEEREPAPLFGCACENPLSVDTCCAGCIEVMREQEAEANGTPTPTAPGAIPDREADDTPTAPQCRTCLNPLRDCKCPTTKGPRS